MDSTDDPQYGQDGGAPVRLSSPPVPTWQPFTPVGEAAGWTPPVDPALLSPPTGIPLGAQGLALPPPQASAVSPVLGATLRPPLARAGAVRGDRTSDDPIPGVASGSATWGAPFPQIPGRVRNGTGIPAPTVSLVSMPVPTRPVPDATADVRWFDPVVEPEPGWSDAAPDTAPRGAAALEGPGRDTAAWSDATPGAGWSESRGGSGRHQDAPLQPARRYATEFAVGTPVPEPAAPADPATVAFALPAGARPPLSRRARRAAEQASAEASVEAPGTSGQPVFRGSAAIPAAAAPSAVPVPPAPRTDDHDHAGDDDWVELPSFARPASDDVWFAGGTAAPDPVLRTPGLVAPGSVASAPTAVPGAGRAADPGMMPAPTGLFPGASPAVPPLGPPTPPDQPRTWDRAAAPGRQAPVAGGAESLEAEDASSVRRSRGGRDRGETTESRTTSSIPVIRPPVALRRPDDESDVLDGGPTMPVRAKTPPAAQQLFTAPASRAKDGEGSRASDTCDAAVANFAPPTVPAPVPYPVAPKPPSLDVTLDPEAIAARPGRPVGASSTAPGARPGSPPRIVPVPLTDSGIGASFAGAGSPPRVPDGGGASGRTAPTDFPPPRPGGSAAPPIVVPPTSAGGGNAPAPVRPPAAVPVPAGPSFAGPHPTGSMPPGTDLSGPAVSGPAGSGPAGSGPAGSGPGASGRHDANPARPQGWADPSSWTGGGDHALLPGAPSDYPIGGWPGLGNPEQPSTTVVPGRSRGLRRNRRSAGTDDWAGRRASSDQASSSPGAPERSRLLSLVVFWAPAIILLVLAGVVIWVVR